MDTFERSPLHARIQAALHRERRRGWRRWLVLERTSAVDLERLHVTACALAGTWGAEEALAAPQLSREALVGLQSEICRGLAELLAGRSWVVEPKRMVSIVVGPAPGPASKQPWSYYLGRADAVRVPMAVAFKDAELLVLERRLLRRAAEELAPHIHERIRRCHWCGEIFARRGRRDLYCSKACAQKERDNRKLPKGRKICPPYIDKVELVESTPYAKALRRRRETKGGTRAQ